MITRRDLIVAVVTVCATITAVALAQSPEKPAMKSAVFNWDSFKPEPKKFGAMRQCFEGRTATLDLLSCHITTLNPGQSPHELHHHPEEELVIVKEGALEVMQNGVMNHATAGSIIFQASNETHGLRNADQVPATYYVIQWVSPGMMKNKPQ